MSRTRDRVVQSAALLIATAGLAAPALASLPINYNNVIIWNRAGLAPTSLLGAPAGSTWNLRQNFSAFGNTPVIGNDGRVYLGTQFNATPPVFGTTTSNVNAWYTATIPGIGAGGAPAGGNNIALLGTFADGYLTPSGNNRFGNNAGSGSGIGTAVPRMSGSTFGTGALMGNLAAGTGGIVETATTAAGLTVAPYVNTSALFAGTAASMTQGLQRGASVPLTGAPAAGVLSTDMRGLSAQATELMSNGSWLFGATFHNTFATTGSTGSASNAPPPITGAIHNGEQVFQPALAGSNTAFNWVVRPGNNSALVHTTAAGVPSVVVRAGEELFPGGPMFRQGGQNGVGGFQQRANRNGEIMYDADLFVVTNGQSTNVTTNPVQLTSVTVTNGPSYPNPTATYTKNVGPGGVTPLSNSVLLITANAGAGFGSLVYREGATAPVTPTSNGTATFTGAANVGSHCFSNAGAIYTAALTGGDVRVPIAPATTVPNPNDQMLMISTRTGGTTPTYSLRKDDVAPGFAPASGVNIGSVTTNGMAINNSGFVVFGATLQGPSVTRSVGVQFTFGTPQTVSTTGIQGNDQAFFAGVPGSTLQAIARTGDLAPGIDGYRMNVSIGSQSLVLNNSNDVLFNVDTTPYLPGNVIGVLNGPPSTVLAAGPTVLYGWNTAFGLVPLLHTGQQIEIEPGVTRSLFSWTILGNGNADGGAMGMNDSGLFAVRLNLFDTANTDIFNGGTTNSNAIVILQIPAPGTAGLALVGLGVLARRRRRN